VPTIRRLPETLVNRIAAGEVVERPAAALKELVENALDAGARNIAVRLAAGGLDCIETTDDGCGMEAAEIVLALERHATSKLPDDAIELVATLGFRGEALPSIASVSRLTIESRAGVAGQGWRRVVDHGTVVEDGPAALPPGTRIRVEELFARVPARRKFRVRRAANTLPASMSCAAWRWRGRGRHSRSNTMAAASLPSRAAKASPAASRGSSRASSRPTA
jgi:DNA mismatch repair protein MutL